MGGGLCGACQGTVMGGAGRSTAVAVATSFAGVAAGVLTNSRRGVCMTVVLASAGGAGGGRGCPIECGCDIESFVRGCLTATATPFHMPLTTVA